MQVVVSFRCSKNALLQVVLAGYVHRMRYNAPLRYCIEHSFHTNPSTPYVQYQVLGECSATVSIVTVSYVLQAIPNQGNARRDPKFTVLN